MQSSVFVISGIWIWCPSLLQRANTGDWLPIMLYFPRIKSIFACEEYVNQWKPLFGMICNDERLTAFCSPEIWATFKGLCQASEEAGFAPWVQREAVLEESWEVTWVCCVVSWGLIQLLIHSIERLSLIFEWKPKSPCLKITRKPLSKYTKAK